MEQATPSASAPTADQSDATVAIDPTHPTNPADPFNPVVSTDEQDGGSPKRSKVPVSCTKAFDSLYFCYSPFYQARQYYITGELDNCRGRLRRFRMCVMSRFRPQADSELLYEEDDRKVKRMKGLENVQPVWQLRNEFLEAVERAEQEELESGEQPPDDGKRDKWWL